MKRIYFEPDCEIFAVESGVALLTGSELNSAGFGEKGSIDDRSGESWW